MKITDVKTVLLTGPCTLDPYLSEARTLRSAAFIVISTDCEHTGIGESVLVNSRSKPEIDQRNVQLLLWSVVSGSDFNKLSNRVQSDAMRLLTAKQIFELKGGVMGVVKTVANHLPSGITGGNNDIYRLFEMGTSSYEAYERIAVLRESSKIKRADFKNDQW